MAIKYSKLPDTLFRVRVPLMATYTELELEVMGTPIQEDSKGVTTEIDYQMTNVMLPLSRIIDIYSMGMRIMLVDSSEVSIIFNILEEYLSDTSSFGSNFNMETHEEERDVDIDRFADEIFNLNRNNIANNTFNKRSGFDIGISKLAIPNISSKPVVKGRMGVTSSYLEQNTLVPNDTSDVYLTHNESRIEPDSVIRKPKIRKRQRLKPKE